MRTDERFSGYRVLIGCFLVMFVHLGMLSSLGIFIPRMVPDLNETLGRVSLMTSFATIVAFVMSFITPKLLHKFSARVLLGVASVLCGIHFIMYGMAQNVYVLWAGASLGGVVLGCGTNAVIGTIISSWFIRKRSAIIGYVFGGAALGGAAVQFLGGRMIHAVGWRETYILLGVIGFAIALIANLLFIRDPQKLGQKPLGWEDAAVEHEKAEHVTETGVTAKAAMKTPSFWLLFVGIILAGFLITGFQSFAPAFLAGERHGCGPVLLLPEPVLFDRMCWRHDRRCGCGQDGQPGLYRLHSPGLHHRYVLRHPLWRQPVRCPGHPHLPAHRSVLSGAAPLSPLRSPQVPSGDGNMPRSAPI